MHQTGPAALDRSPRPRRLLLLAAPWVLAAGLALVGLFGGRDATRAAATDDAHAGPTSDLPPVAPDGTELGSTTDPTTPVADPDQTTEVGDGEVAAADLLPSSLVPEVLRAARVRLGTAGLDDEGIGPHDDRWPVETHVVAVQRVSSDLAVVTVHGLVLQRTADAWSGPMIEAVAVPLALRPSPAVGGVAWSLPRPAASGGTAVTGTPLDDPDGAVAITAAVVAGGWVVDEVTRLDDLGGGVVAVTFLGRLHDGPSGHHTVWLHHSDRRSVLLPMTTTPPGVPTGEETP